MSIFNPLKPFFNIIQTKTYEDITLNITGLSRKLSQYRTNVYLLPSSSRKRFPGLFIFSSYVCTLVGNFKHYRFYAYPPDLAFYM